MFFNSCPTVPVIPIKKIVGIDINFWLMEASLIPYMSTKTIPSIQIEVKKRNNAEVYHRKVSSNLNIFCMCLGRYTLGDLLQQHVVATCHKKSNQTEFVQLVAATNSVAETKIFLQKFSSTHEAICCWDVSQQCVAATSCPTCTHGIICRHYLLLQVVV